MESCEQDLSDELASELRKQLSHEERNALSSFPYEPRVGVIELIRAADNWFLHTMMSSQIKGVQPDFELDGLYRYGLNKALMHFLDGSALGTGFPMLEPDEASMAWAAAALQQYGRMARIEQMLDMVKTGLMKVHRGANGEYCFKIVSRYYGLERIEREHFEWLRKRIGQLQKPLARQLNRARNQVSSVLRELVTTCDIHGIKYSASPLLDDYFETAGILRSQLMVGQDSFGGDALFDGEEYVLFRGVTAQIVGWTLKHIAFCNALKKKCPNVNLTKCFTIHVLVEDLAREIANSLEIEVCQAERALQTLVLNVGNKALHCMRTAGPPPPFVEVGCGHLLWSVRGCLDAPFEFQLLELKRRSRSDWDRNLEDREDRFRRELYQLFHGKRFHCLARSVKIRLGGQPLTDIDAGVLDTRTGVLGLFQLKWQELFGAAMIERASRKTNLMRNANRWIETVATWVSAQGINEIGQRLGLTRAKEHTIRKVQLFVVGRNATCFSGEEMPDARGAWGTWPQIIRLSHEGLDGQPWDASDPLTWLASALDRSSPFRKSPPKLPREEFSIGTVRVVVMGR